MSKSSSENAVRFVISWTRPAVALRSRGLIGGVRTLGLKG